MTIESPATSPDANFARPNVARMYDYFLGGSHNVAADRAAAEKLTSVFPAAPLLAETNRHFLRRVVRHLAAEAGIRQFLDIGAGLPTQANVHEIVGAEASDSRVVYVDHDPVAVTYSRQLLAETPNTTVVQGDLRHPEELLAHPEVCHLIDFTEPVAVLLVAVLHFVPDTEDPYAAVARLRDAMAPGSHLVLSHMTMDGVSTRSSEQGQALSLAPRSHAEVLRFFSGFDLAEPGLVWVEDWRPERPADGPSQPGAFLAYGGVGIRS